LCLIAIHYSKANQQTNSIRKKEEWTVPRRFADFCHMVHGISTRIHSTGHLPMKVTLEKGREVDKDSLA
jgi:hypothetical protein